MEFIDAQDALLVTPIITLKKYDKMRNKSMLLINSKNPNAVPTIDNATVVVLNRKRIPNHAPIFPTNGEVIHAARFEIPNTNPYWDGVAPFVFASDG